MTATLTKLNIAQDRTQTLTDILQDTLYTAQAAHTPLWTRTDLKRAIELTESIFHMLATIRTRLNRLRDPTQP